MQAAKQAVAIGKQPRRAPTQPAATGQCRNWKRRPLTSPPVQLPVGHWGAILSAAWAMRNTLFKIVVFLCLFLSVLIVLIVSAPSIVTNNVFRLTRHC